MKCFSASFLLVTGLALGGCATARMDPACECDSDAADATVLTESQRRPIPSELAYWGPYGSNPRNPDTINASQKGVDATFIPVPGEKP